MTRSYDPKLKQVDKVKSEVSKEILLNYVLTPDINEHCKGLGHLAVSNKPRSNFQYCCIYQIIDDILRELLHMIVPHLHELLLSSINISEVINHLACLDPQPLRVRMILLIISMQDCMRGNGQTGGATHN